MQFMAWLPGKWRAMLDSSAIWKRRAAPGPEPRQLPTRPAPACNSGKGEERQDTAAAKHSIAQHRVRLGDWTQQHPDICSSFASEIHQMALASKPHHPDRPLVLLCCSRSSAPVLQQPTAPGISRPHLAVHLDSIHS